MESKKRARGSSRPGLTTINSSDCHATERTLPETRAEVKTFCPECDGRIKVSPHSTNSLTVILICERCGLNGNPLGFALAEATGRRRWELYTPSIAYELFGDQPGRRAQSVPPLPSAAKFAGWAERLDGRGPGWTYLRDRGLADDVIREAGIGYDGRDLVFPMRGEEGEICAFKSRAPRDGAKMLAPRGAGRSWPLYPWPEPYWRWVLVGEGELDALRGRSVGLPATSVTLGVGTWRDAWTEALRGRRVVVCFDNDAWRIGKQRVAELRAAGIDARRLSLRRDLGLKKAKGDLSDYLDDGGSAAVLRRAVKKRWR